MTVQQIWNLIDAAAPFDTQAEFDNSGLLVGNAEDDVNGILFALDVTDAVISEAIALGAQLIVSHHPLMFSPRKQLTDADYEGRLLRRLIRANLNVIAAHTNLDQAPGGINDTLAALCGLIMVTGEGYFRCGFLPEPMTAGAFAEQLRGALGDTVRRMGPADAMIRKVGLCSGSGGEEWKKALETGCDAFVSGEIRHHLALEMADQRIIPFECGHFATEEAGLFTLAEALQNALNRLQCNMRVYQSAVSAYAFPPD